MALNEQVPNSLENVLMVRMICCAVVVLGCLVVRADDPERKFPKGLPPIVGMMSQDKKPGVWLLRMVYTRTKVVQRKVIEKVDGKNVESVVEEYVPVLVEIPVQARTVDFKVFRKNGKLVPPNQLPKLFPKETAVLITYGEKVDPFYF